MDGNGRLEHDPEQHDARGESGHDHSGHNHGGAGHTHGVSADADRRYLSIALILIVGFMAFEIVVGILAHSLALLSDAAHMLTDAGALALSLVILRYVQRPGHEAMTYGRRRAEVLSGQANGAVLLVLGLLVIYESVARLITPPDVAGLAVRGPGDRGRDRHGRALRPAGRLRRADLATLTVVPQPANEESALQAVEVAS